MTFHFADLKRLKPTKHAVKRAAWPLAAMALGSGASLVWANAEDGEQQSSETDVAVAGLLKERLPRTAVTRVNCQVVDGVCEVTAGAQLFYVDRTARYLMIGRVYTLQRPVSTLGKRAWIDQRKSDRDHAMARLSERYGMFYFYASSCGACHIFAPILKAVSDRYGLAVLAVSMDGGPTATFPNYVVDAGQYERLGLGTERQVPALVLFDSVTKQPMPIGYGILSQDEIMDRVFQLTQVQPGSDF